MTEPSPQVRTLFDPSPVSPCASIVQEQSPIPTRATSQAFPTLLATAASVGIPDLSHA